MPVVNFWGKRQRTNPADQRKCGTTVWSTLPLNARPIKEMALSILESDTYCYLDLGFVQKGISGSKVICKFQSQSLSKAKCNFHAF